MTQTNSKSNSYCICFSRVSTQSQDLDQQSKAIIQEAERLGYDEHHRIPIEFKESAICLAEDERAGIESLKQTINDNPNIDCVICWELSRIARRADVMYSIRDFFLDHKIQWVVMTPYMKLLEIDGKMSQTSSIMLALFTSLAESEMTIKKERMKRGIDARRERGQWIGGKLRYGYQVNKRGYFEVYEKEASVVRYIYEKYATGKYSCSTLGKELRELGLVNYDKDNTCTTRVVRVLGFDGYDGHDPKYPAIVSTELMNTAKDILHSNQEKRNKAKTSDSQFWLKGMIRDKESDRALSANATAGTYVMLGGHNSTPFKLIHPLIWEETKKQYRGHTDNDELKAKLAKELHDLVLKYEVCAKNVAGLYKKIDRIEERLIANKISEKKAEELEAAIKEEIKNEKNKMMRIQEEERGKAFVFGQIEDDLDDEDYNINLDAYDNESRKKLIKQVIKCVYITRTAEEGSKEKNIIQIEIHNNYNDDVTIAGYIIKKNRYKGVRYEVY